MFWLCKAAFIPRYDNITELSSLGTDSAISLMREVWLTFLQPKILNWMSPLPAQPCEHQRESNRPLDWHYHHTYVLPCLSRGTEWILTSRITLWLSQWTPPFFQLFMTFTQITIYISDLFYTKRKLNKNDLSVTENELWTSVYRHQAF